MNISSIEKKERIAQATLRVIQRDGFAAATYRTIAKESGFSLGSIQNFFKTQNELYTFAMQTIIKNAEKRASSLSLFQDGASIEAFHELLFQFLPLDAERKTELTVWMAFVTKAANEPSLMSIAQQTISKNYEALEQSIAFMQQCNIFNKQLAVKDATERLYVFLEGISLHAIVLPQKYTASAIRRMVREYVHDTFLITETY